MKVPKPRKLSSGNWYIYLRLGGEGVSITETTEKKCIRAAQVIKAKYLAGKREKAAEAKKPITLTQAIDKYIEARENILSPSTIRGYRTIQKHRFTDAMLLSLGRDIDWQKIVNEEAQLCSAKTLTNAWHFISSVLKESTGESPTVRLPQVIKADRPFLEPEQIETFVKAIHGDAAEVPALLALSSLRRSEIKGLLWRNIDLHKQIIHVRGAAVYNENHKLVQKVENKNNTSRRDVPMIPQLLEALSNMDSYKPDDFVVEMPTNTIYAHINRVCKCNGLPLVGLHGLRHSFASLAYHLGMPAKIAMEIGGWSNDQTMQKIYTHIAQTDRIKSQNQMLTYFKKLKT